MEKYTYCAFIKDNRIQSRADVWMYSETAWEVGVMSTWHAVRRGGYAQALVSFVMAYILEAGQIATQWTTESIDFYPVNG
jgi:hypothetical protein